MNVLLALTALFVFLLSLVFLFTDMSKMAQKFAIMDKENKDLEKAIKAAKLTGSQTQIDAAQKAYDNKQVKSFLPALGGCFVAILSASGQFVVMVLEVVVIIAALTMHIGLPLMGYIALAIWIIVLIYSSFIAPKQITRAQKQAEAIGNVYLPKSNIFMKIFGWFPDLYALYVVLVIIGLLA